MHELTDRTGGSLDAVAAAIGPYRESRLKGEDMKQLVLVIVCAMTLGGCYVGVRSPIYGGFEPPVVVPPPGVAVPPPVMIEPGWELYPWVYGAPYGYWGGGSFGGHYWVRGHYGYSEWRGPGRSYGPGYYGSHPGIQRR